MYHESEFYGFCTDYSLCLVNCCYLPYTVLMSIVFYVDVSTVFGKWLHLCKLTGVKSSSWIFGNWNKKSRMASNHIYIYIWNIAKNCITAKWRIGWYTHTHTHIYIYIYICTVLSVVSASAIAQLVLTYASKVGTHICNLGIDHILLLWSYCHVLFFLNSASCTPVLKDPFFCCNV